MAEAAVELFRTTRMSLFRRKNESENEPGASTGTGASKPADETLTNLPQEREPGSGQSAPPQAAEPATVSRRELFRGSIEAPAAGAVLGATVEIDACLAEGAIWTDLRIDWSADENEWRPLRIAGDDYELTVTRAGSQSLYALTRSIDYEQAKKRLLESEGYERVDISPAKPSSWQGRRRFLIGLDTGSIDDGSCFLRPVSISAGGEEVVGDAIEVLVDNLGPEVSLSKQPAGRVLSGLVTLEASAEDAVSGVSVVELEVANESGNWRRVTDARQPPYELRWSTESLDDGRYRLRVVARDGSGNLGLGEPVEVEIANEPAAAELVDPGKYLRGHVNLIGRAADVRSAQMIFEIASAGSQEWRAIGTARAPFHLPLDTRQFVDGNYELRIESVTTAGHSVYSPRLGPFVVDNTPPAVEIVKPRAGETLRGRSELLVSVVDEVSGVERVELGYTEAGEWRPLAEQEPDAGEVRGFWQTEACEPGGCQLRALAFDRAGNESSHVIGVTIEPPVPTSAPEPEPPSAERGLEQAESSERAPHLPSTRAGGRFGEIPNWDWQRREPEPGEIAASAKPEPEAGESAAPPDRENEALPPAAAAKKGVAWHWKAPAPEPAPTPPTETKSQAPESPLQSGTELAPESEEAPEQATEPEPEAAEPVPGRGDVSELEPAPEPGEKPKPEPAPEPDEEPEPVPEPGEKPEPEPAREPEEKPEPKPAIRLIEPVEAEQAPGKEERQEPEPAEPAAEGGRLLSFPRGARGWDIWELSELVEEATGQDPVRQEERRQILYHLREHATVDGRIPPEFEGLIYETFGDLMPDESDA